MRAVANNSFFVLPENVAHYETATQAGGDYYDFFPMEQVNAFAQNRTAEDDRTLIVAKVRQRDRRSLSTLTRSTRSRKGNSRSAKTPTK